jgi:hypothetical protein
MFQLTKKEKAEVVANCDHLAKLKFSPVFPNAFTEHGAIMAASVLNTKRVRILHSTIRIPHSEIRNVSSSPHDLFYL